MNEHSKIVLIIGNGFDLDLGLNTSYKAFWESECCPKGYPAPIIKHLNSSWNGNLDSVKWYDLENELLLYYKQFEQSHQIPDVYDSDEGEFIKYFLPSDPIVGHYNEYENQIESLKKKKLIQVDTGFGCYISIPNLEDLRLSPTQRDVKALSLINDGLCNYLSEVVNTGVNTKSIAYYVLAAIKESMDNGASTKIYSFNYTPLPSPYDNNLSNVLYYVHGRCSKKNIIVGTQDYNYSKEYDFLQKSFDPKYNPPSLVYDMLEADEVIIFGHSLGLNDSQYFKAFFKQQISSDHPQKKRITIFTRDKYSVNELKRSLNQITDYNLSALYGLNDFEFIKTDKLSNNIELFHAFLERHIADSRQVKTYIKQLQNV